MKKFDIVYEDISAKISIILEASKEVRTSKKFQTILKIILALGNYLNQGSSKGHAKGFKLSSLKTICDTKSSTNKNFTLLHYIIQVCENEVYLLLMSSKTQKPSFDILVHHYLYNFKAFLC